jgi:hypothetical protein
MPTNQFNDRNFSAICRCNSSGEGIERRWGLRKIRLFGTSFTNAAQASSVAMMQISPERRVNAVYQRPKMRNSVSPLCLKYSWSWADTWLDNQIKHYRHQTTLSATVPTQTLPRRSTRTIIHKLKEGYHQSAFVVDSAVQVQRHPGNAMSVGMFVYWPGI